MTSFCVYKYFKNVSVVSVSYKVFHGTPDDVYPSISFCFQSERNGPFVDILDIKKNDIASMMQGRTTFNQSLLGNSSYEDITIKLEIRRCVYVVLPEGSGRVQCAKSLRTYGDGVIKCFTARCHTS